VVETKLTETRGHSAFSLTGLDRLDRFAGSQNMCVLHGCGESHARGVSLLYSAQAILVAHVLDPKFVVAAFSWRGVDVVVGVLYPDAANVAAFWRRASAPLAAFIEEHASATGDVFILGDFNFVTLAADRLPPRSRADAGTAGWRDFLGSIRPLVLDGWLEAKARRGPRFTHCGTRGGQARLDRIYGTRAPPRMHHIVVNQ
jgi:hypothetical protein